MSPLLARMVLPAALVLLLWLFAAAVKARAVKDESGFTLAFVEAVKQRWPGARVDVHAPLHLAVDLARTLPGEQVSLSDAYLQYRADPSRLADLVEEQLRSLDPAREDARPRFPLA